MVQAHVYHPADNVAGSERRTWREDLDHAPDHAMGQRVEKPVWTTLDIKAAWFQVIHDIVPTYERLARIHLRDTAQCPLFGRTDTLLHRLTECNGMADIWA